MESSEGPDANPLGRILAVRLDYEAGKATFVRDDLQIATAPLTRPAGVDDTVSSSTFLPRTSRMEFVARGHTLPMTLGTVRDRCDLPTVYLDQKDWINFARWEKDPTRLSTGSQEFYKTLSAAADEERLILPLSSAHMMETSKRGGSSRLELATTMLRYSRGWQLRSVLALRRAELRSLFGGAPLDVSEVITLAPQAAFDMERGKPLAPDLGPEVSGLIERQVWATTMVSLLLDEKPMPFEAAQVVHDWSQSFLPLAKAIPGNPKAKAHIRDLTRTRFISDLGTDLPAAAKEAGWTPAQFGDWLRDKAEEDLPQTPGLGRMREVLHLRIANASEKWEANDLNDWLHLSYASAYCDLVLGERKTINYLRRIDSKVPAGAAVHFKAEEALADLERILEAASTTNGEPTPVV